MPNDVPRSPAPRSLFRWSGLTTTDVVDLGARLGARACEDLREDDVHRGAEEGDDENGNGGGDDALAAVVDAESSADASRRRAAHHVGDDCKVAEHCPS